MDCILLAFKKEFGFPFVNSWVSFLFFYFYFFYYFFWVGGFGPLLLLCGARKEKRESCCLWMAHVVRKARFRKRWIGRADSLMLQPHFCATKEVYRTVRVDAQNPPLARGVCSKSSVSYTLAKKVLSLCFNTPRPLFFFFFFYPWLLSQHTTGWCLLYFSLLKKAAAALFSLSVSVWLKPWRLSEWSHFDVMELSPWSWSSSTSPLPLRISHVAVFPAWRPDGFILCSHDTSL